MEGKLWAKFLLVGQIICHSFSLGKNDTQAYEEPHISAASSGLKFEDPVGHLLSDQRNSKYTEIYLPGARIFYSAFSR